MGYGTISTFKKFRYRCVGKIMNSSGKKLNFEQHQDI